MLYCGSCRRVVEGGQSQCPDCRNGFVAQLVCGDCGRPVARGLSSCPQCSVSLAGRQPVININIGSQPPHSGIGAQPPTGTAEAATAAALVVGSRRPSTSVGLAPLTEAPPVLPGLPAHVRLPELLPETYRQDRFGVKAEVQTDPRDTHIMNEMAQLVVVLHTVAEHMSTGFSGHMDSTRKLIKGCRNLAADLQEEIEIRVGPRR